MVTYFLAWFPMLAIAVLNGVLREGFFKRFMSDLPAHQLSTITLILFFAAYIRFVIYKYPPASSFQSIVIGIMWLVLTLCFEFGFGRYRGNSWSTLFADYNLLKGRLWILVPIWIAVAPYLFYKWQQR